MKNLILASVVAISTLSVLPANAQFRVGVSNKIKSTVGTEGQIQNLKVNETSNTESSTTVKGNTQTVKIEAYAPNATATLKFDGDSFTGRAFASTNAPVDPVVIGVYSNFDETYQSNTSAKTGVKGTIQGVRSGYFEELEIDASSYLN
jgi:hypothetical protein